MDVGGMSDGCSGTDALPGKPDTGNSKVEKVGRSVRVSTDIRLDAVELNRQQTLRLVPVWYRPMVVSRWS